MSEAGAAAGRKANLGSPGQQEPVRVRLGTLNVDNMKNIDGLSAAVSEHDPFAALAIQEGNGDERLEQLGHRCHGDARSKSKDGAEMH